MSIQDLPPDNPEEKKFSERFGAAIGILFVLLSIAGFGARVWIKGFWGALGNDDGNGPHILVSVGQYCAYLSDLAGEKQPTAKSVRLDCERIRDDYVDNVHRSFIDLLEEAYPLSMKIPYKRPHELGVYRDGKTLHIANPFLIPDDLLPVLGSINLSDFAVPWQNFATEKHEPNDDSANFCWATSLQTLFTDVTIHGSRDADAIIFTNMETIHHVPMCEN